MIQIINTSNNDIIYEGNDKTVVEKISILGKDNIVDLITLSLIADMCNCEEFKTTIGEEIYNFEINKNYFKKNYKEHTNKTDSDSEYSSGPDSKVIDNVVYNKYGYRYVKKKYPHIVDDHEFGMLQMAVKKYKNYVVDKMIYKIVTK